MKAVEIVATILSLAGAFLINKKMSQGFYCWLASNSAWVYLDVRSGLYFQAAMFVVFFLLSVHGLILWRREKLACRRPEGCCNRKADGGCGELVYWEGCGWGGGGEQVAKLSACVEKKRD